MAAKKKSTLIPGWVPTVYTVIAVFLVPWTIYLAYSLPRRHITFSWDTAWVGLDIMITIGALLTGLAALTSKRLFVMAATITATLLLTDAWFDITGSSRHGNFEQSLVLAIIAEIPIAIFTYVLAFRALKDL